MRLLRRARGGGPAKANAGQPGHGLSALHNHAPWPTAGRDHGVSETGSEVLALVNPHAACCLFSNL